MELPKFLNSLRTLNTDRTAMLGERERGRGRGSAVGGEGAR